MEKHSGASVFELSSKEMQVSPNTISDLKVDASFRKIAKNTICFHIWRIEEDRLEAEPKAQFGTFYDNCAYIIYAAGLAGGYVNQDTVTREVKNGTSIERFIHFWLGEKVSEQKRSNVAHKIQELDSHLGNVAVEYRETQDHESARFLAYFKRGINIRAGALIGSTTPNRLYKLYGRKYLRCIEMETISWEHFCADHICILKTTERLYLWLGRSSSTIERRAAFDVVAKLEKIASNVVVVDDGYEQQMPENCKSLWNSLLPLSKRVVVQAALIPKRDQGNKLKIYKCCYRSQRLQLDQLDVVIPTQEDLNDSTCVFLLDGYQDGIWLWVGRQSPHHDTVSAMGNGRAFMKKKKYAYTTPLVRVVEGYEPIEFIRLFPNWLSDKCDTMNGFKSLSTPLGELDSFTLCQRPKLAAEAQLIDGGNGERTIYRITKDKVSEMPASKVTFFTTNNCFVVKYTVASASSSPQAAQSIGVCTITYQWNGSTASKETIEKSSQFARSTFDKHMEKSMFVQMSEFDETPHFLQIFNGKLIILQSDSHLRQPPVPVANGTSGANLDDTTNSSDSCYVLKVSGNASYNTKSVEVNSLTTLNSKECYVFKTSHVWVWCGQSSTGDAREAAKNVGAALGESSLAHEGKEPKDFWLCLEANNLNAMLLTNGTTGSNGSTSNSSLNSSNGYLNNITNGYSRHGSISPQNANYITNGGYQNHLKLSQRTPTGQLFLVWLQHQNFGCLEIFGYEQSDLLPECVYILDANVVNYIWLGQEISNFEKEKYLQFVQLYLETLPIARRPVSALAVVRQQDEPNSFKGFFDKWSLDHWQDYVSYEQKRQIYMTTSTQNGKNGANGKSSPIPIALLNHHKEFDSHVKYSISVLQQERDLLPTEINPLKRELHLTHDDFVSLFQMPFLEFDELPGWKQQELKKKHKLF